MTCRGSILLGTACRRCERCKQEMARHAAQGVSWPLLALRRPPVAAEAAAEAAEAAGAAPDRRQDAP